MTTPKNLVWATTTDTASPFNLATVARSWNDAFGTGGTNNFTAFMYNRAVPGEWMVFTGHLSAATVMVVDTVIEGSNGASAVAWSAGVKDVSCDIAAGDAREVLSAGRTMYVRAVVGAPTFANGSANVGLTAHGLNINDPVVLSIPQKSATFTVTIASPGVFTLNAHGFAAGQPIKFSSTGALPTGLTAGTTYYVISTGLTANNFEVSTTPGGAAVDTSGTQSGTHYCDATGALPTFSTAGLLVAGTVYYVGTVVDANNVTLSTTPSNANPLGTATVATGTPIYSLATGNDSNDGSAQTRRGAFLTIQKAWDAIADKLDLRGFTVTVQIADSFYLTGMNSSKGALGQAGPESVIFQGNATYPGNVVVSTTNTACFSAVAYVNQTAAGGTQFTVKDVEVRTTTSGNCLFAAGGGSALHFGNIRFGTCAANHIQAQHNAWVFRISNYFIVAGAGVHAESETCAVIALHFGTITLIGIPNFSSAFCRALYCASVHIGTMTYVGTATGTRSLSYGNGVIETFATTTSIPGSIAGTTQSGGQLI